MERWATFDCYGTLIDWNGGICTVLAAVFSEGRADRLLHRYHELEPQLEEADGQLTYREVLTRALERLAEEEGAELDDPAALTTRSRRGNRSRRRAGHPRRLALAAGALRSSRTRIPTTSPPPRS